MTETEPKSPDTPTVTSPTTEPDLVRHNFSFLVGDVSTYFIGMGFVDASTALPALVGKLGGSDVLLGILLALKQAGWYLPQPFAAHYLQGKTEYLRFIRIATFWGRIGFFPAALCVWFLGDTQPTLALGAFALAYMLCWFGDGAGGVPWTAFIGRAIPASQRGRLFATTQFISGFSRLLVGAAVAWLLTEKGVHFPGNLALLILCCGFWVMVSWGCLVSLREPADRSSSRPTASVPAESFAAYLRTFPAKFRERPYLGRLAAVQILAQTAGASIPFLLPMDAAKSGLPGLLLVVQTVGLMVFAPVWGTFTDRKGPRHSLMGHFLVGLLLCGAAIGSLSPGGLAMPCLLVAYFLFGGIVDAWATATNYQLESLPETDRATYIGLMNAATSPTLLLPLLAGLVASTLGKLPLFLCAAICILIGFFLARTLPDTRQKTGNAIR